ncbi:MAG: bifunctional folylpolyglutamate synthase/dihydrofolate synthase [Legionella sp. 40-6]|nr:bifunctional tetrahydrofolate synthase/dihydrofolate synthase [Legionella sp.]OJY28617.1 MAG: bifunctional folylpolyglutamate synthase/dihydrofolate synthase [Legionella sp. 40-6]
MDADVEQPKRDSRAEWNLQQWLFFLEHQHHQEIQLGLERIRSVATKLKLEQVPCPVILVAGTNGKGSTVAALESLYTAAGYRIGVYTSPHLIAFNERIRYQGTPITDEDLCAAFTLIDTARGETRLTYFEMVTLAALWYFAHLSPDIMVLEVGMGGRLDATNIIDADVAIITTIDLDHQEYLGTTREAIGREKAGILRPGKTLIYADTHPPQSILEQAHQLEVKTYFNGDSYTTLDAKSHWDLFFAGQWYTQLPKPKINLQATAAAVIASIILEKKLPIQASVWPHFMQNVFIPGRLQLEEGEINVLYDVAHNAQSVALLAKTIVRLPVKGKIHAVFSGLKDKDIAALIEPMRNLIDHWYLAELQGKRAAPRELLLNYFHNAEIYPNSCYNTPLIAFEAAFNQAQPGDLIVVYGSFYTVGQIMAVKSHRRTYENPNG